MISVYIPYRSIKRKTFAKENIVVSITLISYSEVLSSYRQKGNLLRVSFLEISDGGGKAEEPDMLLVVVRTGRNIITTTETKIDERVYRSLS